jgi:hypothetical protein
MNLAGAKSYLYRFMHLLSFDAWGPDYTFYVGSVCHGSELPFVFNVYTDGESISYPPTKDEVTLTEDIMNAWANFVATGNPNSGLKIPVSFPQYTSVTDAQIVIEEPGSYQDTKTRDSYCNLWILLLSTARDLLCNSLDKRLCYKFCRAVSKFWGILIYDCPYTVHHKTITYSSDSSILYFRTHVKATARFLQTKERPLAASAILARSPPRHTHTYLDLQLEIRRPH